MFTLDWFWGWFSFVAAYFGMCFLVAHGLKKRKHFWIIVSLWTVGIIGFMFLWRFISITYISPMENGFLRRILGMNFFLLNYFFGTLVLFNAYKENYWVDLYCATIAYSMQHLSERIYELAKLGIPNIPLWEWFLLLTSITVVIYFLFYFFFIRGFDYSSFNKVVDHKFQVIASLIIIFSAIYLNNAITGNARDATNYQFVKAYTHVLTIIISFLVVAWELSIVSARKANFEKEKLNELLIEERNHYEKDKEDREILNIKYHDIKHLLNNANSNMDKVVFKEITNTLGLYESIYKTGSEAIDVILSKKSKYCSDNGIKFTCLVDGTQLSALSPYENYSLFENAIDNAIEAVSKCVPEKKIISISQQTDEKETMLTFTNYFTGNIIFKKELPLSQKDPNFHGYGIKSIKMLAEKYGGSIQAKTQGDIFILIVKLPKNKNNSLKAE